MTDEQLAELEALATAATPGPWTSSPVGHAVDASVGVVASLSCAQVADHCHAAATVDDRRGNARFIARARTAVPELIAEVRRLRAAAEVCPATCGGRAAVEAESDALRAEVELLRSTVPAAHAAEVAALHGDLAKMRDARDKTAAAWKAIEQAASCEDLYPEHRGKSIVRYIQETAGRAAQTFRENTALHQQVHDLTAEAERLRAEVADRQWLRDFTGSRQLAEALAAVTAERDRLRARPWERLREMGFTVDTANDLSIIARLREVADEVLGLQPVDVPPSDLLDGIELAYHRERIARINLESERDRLARCESHPDACGHGWGCSDCVAELRHENGRARALLERCRDVFRAANLVGLPPGGGIPFIVADIESALADGKEGR